MSAPEFAAGKTLADRYKLVSLLGQGGMGSVWRAEHLALGSEVAVKLIDPEIANNEEVRARFVREAKAAASLRSPHVVQILDFGVDEEIPFIVMELMNGESLAERLERVGRIPPEQTARIMSDVSRALAKAHEAGIIHRDLKPDNVFLVENDDEEIAKVLDFGVARVMDMSTDNAHMTSTGAVLGTPYYMSPEQAEGKKELDHRTDIWALAVMTYECIVGARPFQGETVGGIFVAICAREIPTPSLVAEVPDGFDAWFRIGTERVLADRFLTARDAAQALRDVCMPSAARMSMPGGEGSGRGSNPGDAALASPFGRPPSESGLTHDKTVIGEGASAAPASLGAGTPEQFTEPGGATGKSVAGLSHTNLPTVPTQKTNLMIWVGAGLIVAAGLVIALVSNGGSEPPMEEEEAVGAAQEGATDPPEAEEVAVEAKDVAEAEEDEERAKEEEPAPIPQEKSAPAPAPRRVAAPAPAPAPVVAPAPRPAPPPAPPPAPKPAPAPAPEAKPRVNLGI